MGSPSRNDFQTSYLNFFGIPSESSSNNYFDTDYDDFFAKEQEAVRQERAAMIERGVSLPWLPPEVPDSLTQESLADWFEYMGQEDVYAYHTLGEYYLKAVVGFLGQSIAEGVISESNESVKVLWRMYDIILKILNRIQDTAITEALLSKTSLELITEYTRKIAEIGKEVEVPDDDASPGTKEEANINNRKIQSKMSKLRGYREFIRNEQLEWANTSQGANEAQEKHTSQLARIISQLAGIMSAIYR